MEELEKYPCHFNCNCGDEYDGEKGVEREEEEEERTGNSPSPCSWCDLELPLAIAETAAEPFRLTKAVCSHGLFMMAPNHWDPLSNTLTRPLRLDHHYDIDDPSSSSSSSSSSSPSSGSGSRLLIVTISQPSERSGCLSIQVHGTRFLSPQQKNTLLALVSRMLRSSEAEEKAMRKFRNMHDSNLGAGIDYQNRSFVGRVFRSPTLLEDMVKCILLCNCQ